MKIHYARNVLKYCDPDVCKTARYVGADSWVCECRASCSGVFTWEELGQLTVKEGSRGAIARLRGNIRGIK